MGGWAVGPRERLRRRYVRGHEMLSRHLEETGALGEALEGYERVLEADPLNEEGYRRLMGCFERLGRRAEALSVYDRCRRVLDAQLGIEPSEETEVLRRRIRESKG